MDEKKRLVKGQDKKLAGVCSGVAKYFGWDTTLVRIIWSLLTLCYGVGLIAYIVGAFLMPSE